MNEIWYKVHRIFSTYLLSGIYTEPKDSYDFTNEVEYGTQHGGLDEVLIAWDFTTGQKLHTICYSDPKDRKIIKDASFTVRVCWPLVAVFRSVDAFKGEVFSKNSSNHIFWNLEASDWLTQLSSQTEASKIQKSLPKR